MKTLAVVIYGYVYNSHKNFNVNSILDEKKYVSVAYDNVAEVSLSLYFSQESTHFFLLYKDEAQRMYVQGELQLYCMKNKIPLPKYTLLKV